ncbi:NAD-binding protein, partial [Kaarinaea lacus]
MKIIVLGAGQVGSSVAEVLAKEANDITIVDTDGKKLQELQDRMDIRTVQGQAAHPEVLGRAGGEDADMI